MRSISMRLAEMEKVKINIGYVGENEHTTVLIDCKKAFDEYPEAVASLTVRPPRGGEYPAVVVRNGNIVEWTVTDSDLIYAGNGEIQLTFTVGEVIVKTAIGTTVINRSLMRPGDIPTPIQNWIEQANQKIAAAEEATREAKAAAEHQPIIDDNGNWNTWDDDEGAYVDTGIKAQGEDGAPGRDGQDGQDGQDGKDGKDGQDGAPGQDGTDATPDLITVPYSQLTFPVTAGTQCYHDGKLYEANQAIQTSEQWTAAHWTETTVEEQLSTVKSDLQAIAVTPEQYGAKGDGVTDDSQAVQDAVDAGYNIRLDDNKTYYLASPVTIDHDVHIIGGKNTKVITKTPSGGTVNNAFEVTGTLKKTTTLTTDYSSVGSTANSGNKFTLTDMDGISIGDLLVIKATDQYYSYARDTYYLGAVLLVADIYDGHIYTPINMPFDIENTENVTVEVYSAPTAIFEELSFVSDLVSRGNYKFFIKLNHAKNSIIKNCDMSQMDNGIWASECFNTLIENVSVSKSKYDNTLPHDGYGIYVYSCTNTVIRRITSICSQGCIDLGGTIPNIDTFIYNCMVGSECRSIGIDMHENSYNIVIEDCTLGGISLFGTAKVNRCKIINNMRAGAYNCYINLRGSHNPAFAEYAIANCLFDGTGILMDKPYVQSPVQTFDNVFGNVEVENCIGGSLVFNPVADATVLSSKAKQILIKNWRNCAKIHHTNGNVIEYLEIIDTPFVDQVFITGETTSDKFYMNNIKRLVYKVNKTNIDKLFVDEQTHGMKVLLPKDVSIQLSSANASAKFIVCGENITPGSADDYIVGTVSGSVGNDLSRTAASASYANCVSIDANGDPVFTQPNLSGQYSFYPVGMLYINEPSKIAMSATLKNTGETDGASWYPYIVILNGETGKIKYRGSGTVKQASAGGNVISHERDADKGDLVMCYFYCATVVKNSVSTFEDLVFTCTPYFIKPVASEAAYTAKRMTGDGTIKSLEGINNIMCSEMTFNVKFGADYVNNPIGL